MANYYNPYDPIFYANESLIALENALGISKRVHMGYDEERKSANKGSTIQIKAPGTFSTSTGGTDAPEDLNPTSIQMVLDDWVQVKFQVSDKELAYTSDQIIADHIQPACYTLASYIDGKVCALHKDVGNFYDWTGTISNDMVDGRKKLRDTAGNILDRSTINLAVDSTVEAQMLKATLFHSAGVAGDPQNKEALLRGSLGVRFGLEPFVQQGMSQFTSGTVVSAGTDVLGALNGNHSERATTISVNNLSGTETFKKGDTFIIAGNDQRYVVAADASLTAGANASVSIYPALKQDYSTGAVVTFEDGSGAVKANSYYPNIMFHKNAFALATAPLPTLGNQLGAKMWSIQDPRTGLSIRARLAYKDGTASVVVTLDVLFGVKTLDPNLALICRRS